MFSHLQWILCTKGMIMKLIIILTFIISFAKCDIVIVTNKKSSFDSLSKEMVQYLYLGQIDYINHIKMTPLLSDERRLHDKFLKKIINKTSSQYNSYWSRLIFTGLKPFPQVCTKKTLEMKLEEINAIAYINEEDLEDNWKIVYKEK